VYIIINFIRKRFIVSLARFFGFASTGGIKAIISANGIPASRGDDGNLAFAHREPVPYSPPIF
jgi:hypothetical protein